MKRLLGAYIDAYMENPFGVGMLTLAAVALLFVAIGEVL